jgi:integrase
VKLTQRLVDSLTLPVGKIDAVYYDDELPGFGLRLRAGGGRGFVVQYKLGTKHRRMTLGSTAQIRLDAARDRARDILAAVRLGHDPAGDKQEARVRAADTCAAVVQRYLARAKERLRARSYSAAEHALLNLWKPLQTLSIAKVDRRTVAAHLGTIVDARGPAAADRARAVLSAFFVWAMREGLVETNPVIGTNRPNKSKGRERVLTKDELRQIWQAAGDGAFGVIVKLLILTGQRRAEIGSLRWSEIDPVGRLIRLEAARVKNGKAHDVPLSAPAMALLQAIAGGTDTGNFVFGRSAVGFTGFGAPKKDLELRLGAARVDAGDEPMTPWVIHDIRRSVATHMAELGVQPHIIEAILNHTSGHKAGVAGIYNRATYEREKRQALDLWADHIIAAIDDRMSNVVSLRA